MHLRRTLAVTLAALALITLSACGRDFATDKVNNIAHGATEREGTVDVLNAVIVSAEDGSGTFIASLANNDTEEPATFEVLEGIDQAQLTADEFEPIEIAAGGLVNLATEGGVGVEGDFAMGNFVPVSVQFGSGEQVEMEVPVVPNCGDFEGLDGPVDEAACEPEHETEGH
jgi:hypothetical protein